MKKKHYKAKYCIGCESFKNDSELMDGVCPDHNASLKIIDEENYFFLISKYKDIIKEKIQKNIIRIYPEYRKLEILNLIDNSEDVSFSRPTDKVI
ncbi:MAG: hypothetical protein ORN26_02185 [Candidatus Pacebacteria bacterium]|nr:hypothetical protein [Candidatus Paceibacterota bacterium]